MFYFSVRARHLCALTLMMSHFACAQGESALVLPNGDFEAGVKSWKIQEKAPMSAADVQAAHGGKLGLRVRDDDATAGSSALSEKVAVTAGQNYRLNFWSRTDAGNAAVVQFRFFDANGKTLDAKSGRLTLDSTKNAWQERSFEGEAPQNAVSLAVWIHSYPGAKAALDFDDFSLSAVNTTSQHETTEAAPPTPPTAKAPDVAAPAPAPRNSETAATKTNPARQSPPYIIIKVDDLRHVNGRVHARWKRFADFIKERKVHASIGIIANSLEGDHPAYIGWVKEQQATGLFEFWNHGYVHDAWKENGKEIREYQGTSYEAQKEFFHKTQTLAREKLGAPFATFGAPYNSTDENTVKVLTEDPDTKIWLYGQDEQPAGKLVLDRVYPVNIENPLFVPSLDKFIEGYNRYPKREYFVIQGHAAKWDDARFEQFTRIVDFLIAQKAIFVTPSEYAAIQAKATP